MNDRRAHTQCLALQGYSPITVAYYRDKGGAVMRLSLFVFPFLTKRLKTERHRHTFHLLVQIVLATAPVVEVLALVVAVVVTKNVDVGVDVDVVVDARQRSSYA